MSRCAHDWHATPRASTPSLLLPGELLPQKCSTCATRYPCAGQCDHLDCRTERGESIPEWAGGPVGQKSDTTGTIQGSDTPVELVGTL